MFTHANSDRPSFARMAILLPRAAIPVLGFLGLIGYDALMGAKGFRAIHRTVRTWPRRAVRPSYSVGESFQLAQAAMSFYPVRCRCLKRAAVATCLLRTLGFPAVMVIGVNAVPFRSHAWVECEGEILDDDPNYCRGFEVLEKL